MAIFNMTEGNSVGKFVALGAVVVVLGVGLFVLSSGTDTNNTAVTETATGVQATTTTTTGTPVVPANNNVNGTTTTGSDDVIVTPVPNNNAD